MRTLAAPSRTVSALAQRAANAAKSRPLSAVPIEQTRSESPGRVERTAVLSQNLDSQQLALQLQELDAQVSESRLAGQLRREQRVISVDLSDILPVELHQEKQQSAERVSGEEDFEGRGLSIQERLVKFRNNPELYQRAVLDAERARDDELRRKREEDLRARKAHKRAMGDDTALIADFVKYNRYQVTHGNAAAEHVEAARTLNSALVNARVESARAKVRQNTEMEKTKVYMRQMQQSEPEKQLPRIYTQQKCRLGVIFYFTARFSALHKRAAEFEFLNERNQHLVRAAVMIQKFARMHAKCTGFKQAKAFAAVCQRVGRFWLTHRNVNARRKCLNEMRSLMLANYWQCTSLGAVSRFYDCKTYLARALRDYDAKMTARQRILHNIVESSVEEAAVEDWTRQRTRELTQQCERLKSNPKRHKEYKAFIAEYPPGSAVVPRTEVDLQNLEKRRFSAEQLRETCLLLLQRLQRQNAEDLEYNFAQNSSPAQLNAFVLNLVCSRECVRKIYAAVASGVTVRAAVDSAGVLLEKPSRALK